MWGIIVTRRVTHYVTGGVRVTDFFRPGATLAVTLQAGRFPRSPMEQFVGSNFS